MYSALLRTDGRKAYIGLQTGGSNNRRSDPASQLDFGSDEKASAGVLRYLFARGGRICVFSVQETEGHFRSKELGTTALVASVNHG